MSDAVKIVECPRDAWQGLTGHVPPERKAEYLRALLAAGFRHIDAASFVSPTAVPQMADSESALALLQIPDGAELIGIVVNTRGAERAIATKRVQTLGFPYSISAGFLERNQRQTPKESLDTLAAIRGLAEGAGLGVVAYVSMAFGNPYGEEWSVKQVVSACSALAALGVQQISLADTVGLATPTQIAEVMRAALEVCGTIEVGLHLHASANDAAAKIRAGYEAGCRRFDAAIGGLGGCPFAQDQLVGNIPTELLLATLHDLGATLPKLAPLHTLLSANAAIASEFGGAA